MEFNDDTFMSDPFLSLDNDLDDVSEVIRGMSVFDRCPFDSGGGQTPSPQQQQQYTAQISPQQQQRACEFQQSGQVGIDTSKERQIDQIVNLLQSENTHSLQHSLSVAAHTQNNTATIAGMHHSLSATTLGHSLLHPMSAAQGELKHPKEENEIFVDTSVFDALNERHMAARQNSNEGTPLLQKQRSKGGSEAQQLTYQPVHASAHNAYVIEDVPPIDILETGDHVAHHHHHATGAGAFHLMEEEIVSSGQEHYQQQFSPQVGMYISDSPQQQLTYDGTQLVHTPDSIHANAYSPTNGAHVDNEALDPTTRAELMRMLLGTSGGASEQLRTCKSYPLLDPAGHTSTLASHARQHYVFPVQSIPLFVDTADDREMPISPLATDLSLPATRLGNRSSHLERKSSLANLPKGDRGMASPTSLKAKKKFSLASISMDHGEPPLGGGVNNGALFHHGSTTSPVSPAGHHSPTVFSSCTSLMASELANFGWRASESDEEDEDEHEGLDPYDGAQPPDMSTAPFSPTKRAPRTERRTAHNLIEKKYRCSINDRINHLKEMLSTGEGKMSKSATLRRAIEHINALRRQNNDLARENERLRAAIGSMGIECMGMNAAALDGYAEPKASHIQASRESSPQQSAASPSASSTGSSSAAHHRHSNASSSARKGSGAGGKLLLGKARFSLSIVMLIACLFTPHSMALSIWGTAATAGGGMDPLSSNASSRGSGLFNSEPASEWSNVPSVIWALCVPLAFYFFLLVLVDPVVESESPAWEQLVETRQQAECAFAEGNYNEAQRLLCECLQILGRRVPSPGGLKEHVATLWQIMRHLLNGVWIGRWLVRRRRWTCRSVEAICRSHSATALIYHQLHQLSLVGINTVNFGQLGALHIALCAVNLAESAGIDPKFGMTHQLRADIYVCMALRARLALPRLLGLSSMSTSYFFKRARRHSRKASKSGEDMRALQWVFHALAKRFYRDSALLRGVLGAPYERTHFPFTSNDSPSHVDVKPIERLRNDFKLRLLILLLKQLSGLGCRGMSMADSVEMIHLLLELTEVPPTTRPPAKKAGAISESWLTEDWVAWQAHWRGDLLSDPVCAWWTHLLAAAIYWKHGDMAKAKEHYSMVRCCPSKLLKSDLALGIGFAFCARKMCLEDSEKSAFTEMVWAHSRRAFAHIEKNSTGPAYKEKAAPEIVAIAEKHIRATTLEWILTSMMELWNIRLAKKTPYWEQPAPQPICQLYSATYASLTSMSETYCSEEKRLVFKLMERALTCASPVKTWSLMRKVANGRLSSPAAACLENMRIANSNSATRRQEAKMRRGVMEEDPLLELQLQFTSLTRIRRDFNCVANLELF